jgi:hypothetical protein
MGRALLLHNSIDSPFAFRVCEAPLDVNRGEK